jgi:3-hydroxyacyl-[acyl-carrier-protein] dehydratase
MPIVPGVCMMQMAKELIEFRYGKKTRIIKAANLKFLSILNPQSIPW